MPPKGKAKKGKGNKGAQSPPPESGGDTKAAQSSESTEKKAEATEKKEEKKETKAEKKSESKTEVKVEAVKAVDRTESELHRRTLRFVVSVAASTVFPNRRLAGGHAIGEGYFYAFVDEKKALSEADLKKLSKAVNDLVESDAKINTVSKPFAEVVNFLKTHNQPFAARLLETHVRPQVSVHECDGQLRVDLFPLMASCGGLKATGFKFELQAYRSGFVAVYGLNFVPQPAIADSVDDHLKWAHGEGVDCVGDLNRLTADRSVEGRKDFILAAEYRQDMKIAQIAQQILDRGRDEKTRVRVLCIAGPSSSGKTTFATKLATYLKNFGYDSKALSVDHYYYSLADQPRFKIRGERNDVDYDSIDSMDVPLVNDHVTRLIAGETVFTPKYDFKSGNRVPPGHEFSLPSNGILVMEGIHALNPDYTAGIPKNVVYRIYISPITGLQLDDFNALKTTNHRCLRRMTRDYLFRGYSAVATLQSWPKVRRGEHLYIFDHQNNADYVMNSAMEYEIPVLKTYAEPLLNMVPLESPGFHKAAELLDTLKYIAGWPERAVPSTSIFREFIGDGVYGLH